MDKRILKALRDAANKGEAKLIVNVHTNMPDEPDNIEARSVPMLIMLLDSLEQQRQRAERSEAERQRFQEGLDLIMDIALDRDGYSGDAEKLGELVDELGAIARKTVETDEPLYEFMPDADNQDVG